MGAKPNTQATIDALEAAIDALKAAENDLPDATEPALRHTQLRSPHPKRIRGIAAVGVFTLILEAFIMIVLTAASFLGGEPFELSAVGGETFLVLPPFKHEHDRPAVASTCHHDLRRHRAHHREADA